MPWGNFILQKDPEVRVKNWFYSQRHHQLFVYPGQIMLPFSASISLYKKIMKLNLKEGLELDNMMTVMTASGQVLITCQAHF